MINRQNNARYSLLIIVGSRLFAQSIINVPTDYPTIQAALNAAGPGDSVVVEPDTYYENIIWPLTKNVTLTSSNPPQRPEINGAGIGPVVLLRDEVPSVIDTNSSISHMTLRNGRAANGGGVYIESGGIKISNSSIWQNIADSHGGGLYISSPSSRLILNDVIFTANRSDYAGGGMYAANGIFTLINVDFLGNRTEQLGGGLYVSDGNLTYRYGKVIANQTKRDLEKFDDLAGGMLISSSTAFLSHLKIRKNQSARTGGLWTTGNIHFEHSDITDNIGGSGGGGRISGIGKINDISVVGNISTNGLSGGLGISGNIEMKRAFIYKNRAASNGAGLGIGGGGVTLDSVYIYENEAYWWGGGIAMGSGVTITNSIIYGNRALSGGGVYAGSGNHARFQYVLVSENEATDQIVFDGFPMNTQPVFAGGIQSLTDTLNIVNSTISHNKTTGDPGGIRVRGDSRNIIMNRSNIYGNSVGLTMEPDAGFAQIDDNWWGDSTGPFQDELNLSGEGDRIRGITDMPEFRELPDPDALLMPPNSIVLLEGTTREIVLSWTGVKEQPSQGYRVFFSYDTLYGVYTHTKVVSSNMTTFRFDHPPFDETVKFAVATIGTDGRESFPGPPFEVKRADLTALGVETDDTIPDQFYLEQNFPNPFNPATRIEFNLPIQTKVGLKVYDIMGREVASLIDTEVAAGFQQVTWNGQNKNGQLVPSGIYIARLVTPNYIKSIKMVLLK